MRWCSSSLNPATATATAERSGHDTCSLKQSGTETTTACGFSRTGRPPTSYNRPVLRFRKLLEPRLFEPRTLLVQHAQVDDRRAEARDHAPEWQLHPIRQLSPIVDDSVDSAVIARSSGSHPEVAVQVGTSRADAKCRAIVRQVPRRHILRDDVGGGSRLTANVTYELSRHNHERSRVGSPADVRRGRAAVVPPSLLECL